MSGLDVSSLQLEGLLEHEWLAVNHIGGYACSTPTSLNTRKYHGLLVAAMSPPVRRMVLLSRVEETVHCNGWPCALSCNEYPGTIHPQGHQFLKAFNTDPFPRWAYQGESWTLEKSLRLIRGENTVILSYTMLAAGSGEMTLEIRPLLALRGIHELMYQWNGRLVAEQQKGANHHRVAPTSRTPEVFFAHDEGAAFDPNAYWYLNTIYRREQERGYAGLEDLWSPGAIRWRLTPGRTVHFVFSTEPIDLPRVLREADRQTAAVSTPPLAEMAADRTLDVLVRAADQHVVTIPKEESSVSVITHYPWAPPSGRGALIGFTGLLLIPGRYVQARSMLEHFAGLLNRGVMPSDFPEDGSAPLRRGADVSLWFINAAYQYLRYTGDESFVRNKLWDAIAEIIRAYQHGADLGISADADGLIISHVPGAGTTWMDAKAGDWVITPRHGRAVEINALWYNAICIAAELARHFDTSAHAEQFEKLASSVKIAFNRRFWNAAEHCCYDVIDDHGQDPSIRPNQIFAISLPFAVLEQDRQRSVLERVRSELLTPVGLRTLSPRDPSYQGRYSGNVVSRDRAYHQGSAFPWLLGPMVSAHVRVHGRGERARADAMRLIEPALHRLQTAGMGSLCELFDGDAPYRPGGAIACAPAVAEILRAYVEDILNRQPHATDFSVTRLADLTLQTRKVPTAP